MNTLDAIKHKLTDSFAKESLPLPSVITPPHAAARHWSQRCSALQQCSPSCCAAPRAAVQHCIAVLSACCEWHCLCNVIVLSCVLCFDIIDETADHTKNDCVMTVATPKMQALFMHSLDSMRVLLHILRQLTRATPASPWVFKAEHTFPKQHVDLTCTVWNLWRPCLPASPTHAPQALHGQLGARLGEHLGCK